jgi:hypothetical protein
MSFSSGKWRMKRRSGERSPRECSPGTKSSSDRMCSSATAPTRVMMCMLAVAYALSETIMPTRLMDEPAGPMR